MSSLQRDNRVGFYIFCFVCVVAIAIAIAEICVVRYDLRESYYNCYSWSWCTTYSSQCLLGANTDNFGPCNYAYAIGGISLIFSAMVICFAHIKTLTINVFFAFGGFAWWLAGAIVMTIYVQEANDDNLPKEASRSALLGLCWSNMVLFLVSLAACAYFWNSHRNDPPPSQAAPPPPVNGYHNGVQMQPPYPAGAPPNTYQYTVPPPQGSYYHQPPPGPYYPPTGAPPGYTDQPVQGFPVYPPPPGFASPPPRQ